MENNLNHVYRGTIGMEKMLRNLIGTTEAVYHPNDGFPFYNIIKLSEHEYELTLALAGYSEDDIEITLEGNELTVSSKGMPVPAGIEEYIHRGFTSKAFTRKFTLGTDVEVVETTSNYGLLSIHLVHKVPESAKKKVIRVGERRDTRTQLNG
jgi:molecular chaperone IbpA